MFNIDTAGTYLFIGHINDLDVDAAYVGNTYLHVFTKGDIYTVTVPDFG